MNKLDTLNLEINVKESIEYWLSDDYDEATRKEIRGLIDAGDDKALTDRFYKNLEFGTGGLRGVMEAGTNRMNRYTVRMASQGLANYILSFSKDFPSVVIACDSRNNSSLFAAETASVMAANGIQAHLFSDLRPVPELSFAVRHLGAMAGIVVTASHNPKEYNGYKVYWEDGSQIITPHDKKIVEEVRKIASVRDVKFMDRSEAERKGLIVLEDKEVDRAYLKKVHALSLQPDMIASQAEDLKIVYTPIHGAGITMVPESLKNYGFKNVYIVEKQKKPDGNFPTVHSPNPEEPDALTLSIELAKKTGADLILATDPDCDRLGIAVLDKRTKEYVLFNGNQLGSLLAWYIFSTAKKKDSLPPRPLMVKTIVTTDLCNAVAESFGIEIAEVLTGFKYICSIMRDNEEKKAKGEDHQNFLFGFEESYGFLAGDFVRDKDAVIASCLTAEMAAFARSQGKTLVDLLDDLYSEYGYYMEKMKYLVFKGKEGIEKISKIMQGLKISPVLEVKGHKLKIMADLSEQKAWSFPDKASADFPYSVPKANVLGLFYDQDLKIMVRPSGTEPKIKYYFFINKKLDGQNLADLKKEIQAYLNSLEEEFTRKIMALAE